eukprot:scaffold26268_cov103-Cylindrotheca_fusiformis.AAC.2
MTNDSGSKISDADWRSLKSLQRGTNYPGIYTPTMRKNGRHNPSSSQVHQEQKRSIASILDDAICVIEDDLVLLEMPGEARTKSFQQ